MNCSLTLGLFLVSRFGEDLLTGCFSTRFILPNMILYNPSNNVSASLVSLLVIIYHRMWLYLYQRFSVFRILVRKVQGCTLMTPRRVESWQDRLSQMWISLARSLGSKKGKRRSKGQIEDLVLSDLFEVYLWNFNKGPSSGLTCTLRRGQTC